MNRRFSIALTICLFISPTAVQVIAQDVVNDDTALSEFDIAAEVEQELVIDEGNTDAPAPIEGDSSLLPQLAPYPDGSRDLPDTTPRLVNEATSLSNSKIAVLKPKHVAAYWARLELEEVFSEEVSAGKVKFAGSDDLLIVRTTSPNVLSEITRLLQAIDQPEKPHRPGANVISAITANDRNAFGVTEVQAVVRDPRHRELQAQIDAHQQAIKKLSDHAAPNSREVQQHLDEIARFEAKQNALEASLLPRIAARRAQISNRIAPPPGALDPLQQKIQEIVAKFGAIQDSTNEVEIKHITATLRQALEQRFEARQARQTEQVNQLRKRLQTLESRIEQRANQRERILRRTMNDLLSNNDNRRQDAVENLHDPAQLASSDSTLPPPRETAKANRVASKQGPIALTDRVNFYYSAADIARKEAELADKQKLYDKGYAKESDVKLARTMLEGSKRAAQSIERALMTQLRMREFDLQEAKVKLELHAAEAKRVEALRKNKAVTAAEARSAIAAERLASIDIDRARAEIEAIATQLKEFHQAHSKE